MLTGNCKDCDKGEICRGGCRGSCFFNTKSKFENAYCSYTNKVIKLTDNPDERIAELKREIERQKKENEIAKLEKELEELKREGGKLKKVPQPSRIQTPEPVIPIGIVRVTAYAVSHDEGGDLGSYINSISATSSSTSKPKNKKKSGILPIRAAYAAPHYHEDDRSDLFRTMSYCAPHDTGK
jgi:hypothetical protein